ncbi:MAG: hypothetical protein ACRD15_23395 [Vicinamibacterales bacterium]
MERRLLVRDRQAHISGSTLAKFHRMLPVETRPGDGRKLHAVRSVAVRDAGSSSRSSGNMHVPPDRYWPRIGRAGVILAVAIVAHKSLATGPHGSRLPSFASSAMSSTKMASSTVSRAVAERPVTLVHEDLVARHVIGERPSPDAFEPEPTRATITRAAFEPRAAEAPVGAIGLGPSSRDAVDLQLLAEPFADARLYEPVLAPPPPDVVRTAAVEPALSYVSPIPAMTIGSVGRPEAPLADVGRLVPAVSRATATAAATDARKQEVLDILGEYTKAYERLDVQAAKAVWPTLDDRALQHAFGQLDAQRLQFASCGVSIAGRDAKARCTGEATYHPKVGSRVLRFREREWTFNLSRNARGWQIVEARILR